MVDSNNKVELLDPKIDYVFKRIFGEKGDEDILMSLINSILKGNPTIKELELLNTEYPKEGFNSKGCQFDILAKTDDGTIVNIEMQYRVNANIEDRIIYYSDRLNVSGLSKGEEYGTKKVISIWICAENISDRIEPISEVRSFYIENGRDKIQKFGKNKRIIILEIQKYKITDDNIKDLLTNWVNFLKTPECLENSEIIKKEENIQVEKALDKLEFMSKKNEEKYLVQSMLDFEQDHLNDKAYNRRIGKEEGLKEGKEEGLKEGEKNKSIEIAKNMLKDNVDINVISKYSGLSIYEIKNLKE